MNCTYRQIEARIFDGVWRGLHVQSCNQFYGSRNDCKILLSTVHTLLDLLPNSYWLGILNISQYKFLVFYSVPACYSRITSTFFPLCLVYEKVVEKIRKIGWVGIGCMCNCVLAKVQRVVDAEEGERERERERKRKRVNLGRGDGDKFGWQDLLVLIWVFFNMMGAVQLVVDIAWKKKNYYSI